MTHSLYIGLILGFWQVYLATSQSYGCGFACLACNNSATCLTCQAGYYVQSNGACAPCPQNCASCTIAGCSVGGCKDGYGLLNGTCAACAPHCSSCAVANTCSIDRCYSGYAYNSTTQTCQPCGTNCNSCITPKTCLPNSCQSRFVYNSSTQTCQACAPYCDSCTKANTCKTNQCWSGYMYEITSQTCTKCISNCRVCFTNNTCEPNGCNSGYTYDSVAQVCRACSSACSYCVADNTCLPNECYSNYAYNATSQTCQVCSSGCSNCTTGNTCLATECASGYTYNTTTMKCDACISNCHTCLTAKTCEANSCINQNKYYNTSLQTCSGCVTGCRICTSSYTCEPNGCNSGYVYNATTRLCSRCASSCSYCSSEGLCHPSGCQSGYTYDAITQQCKSCANYCHYCASAGTCVLNGCWSNYAFVFGNVSQPCVACIPGKTCASSVCPYGFTYDIQGQTCVACPANCGYCASSTECVSTGCKGGFIFNTATKSCNKVTCSSYCNFCSSNATCHSSGCNSYSSIYNATSKVCEACTGNCHYCPTRDTCRSVDCYSRFAYNVTSQKCEACINNCASCRIPNTCSVGQCNSGYGYDVAENKCKPCISRCSYCKIPNTCSVGRCHGGYAYDVVNNECKACTAYCSDCVTPNTCTQRGCYSGYYYDSLNKTCTRSPCYTNSMQCNKRGSCSSVVDYPFYQCTCYAGYTGEQCAEDCSIGCNRCETANSCLPDECIPGYVYNSTLHACQILVSEMYPYGSSVRDKILTNTDDDSTSRILFDQPFLFYGRFLSSAFININGFISFSINYLSYRPMPFPHYNSEDADLLGVFWSDYDSTGINCDCSQGCRTCGRGIVYYQVYSCDPTQSSSPEGFAQEVLSKATAEGRAYVPGFNIATWVMIVTWSQMVPFPYSSNQYSSERNTFQAVLAMDSISMKSFVSYRYLDIKANPIRPATMGIQALKSDEYYNYVGDVYQLHKVVGVGTPVIGFSMFDTSGTLLLKPFISCYKWVTSESVKKPIIYKNVERLPPCPCSGFQAMFSPSHASLPNSDCFATVEKYHNGMGMKCCYDRNAWMWSYHWYQWSWMWTSVWLGDLVVNPVYEAGGYTEYNPLYYSEQAMTEEQAKQDCCIYSTLCSSYYSVRPIKNCDGFIPPQMGSTIGDPHITTFDSLNYDYNGIGEYWLIKSDALHVQVRTVQAKDNNGNPASASVFGAYAIQVPQGSNLNASDRVFLQMISESKLELFILSTDAVSEVNLTDWVRNTTDTDAASDTISSYNGLVVRRLSEGTGVVVTMSTGTSLILRLESGQIGITVTPGPELASNTHGLLGTYDGNSQNDFTLPDGTVLASDIEPEIIYSTFGETWRTTSDESIMYYETGSSHTTYQNKSFIPMFVPQFHSQAEEQAARDTCGSNSQCLLDYAATGNNQLASAVMANAEAVNTTTRLFESSQPVINGSQTLYVTVGKQFTTVYTTTNADGSDVTLSMSGLPSGATLSPTSGLFSWLPLTMETVGNLSVSAKSANDVPAHSIAVAVFMCDGCSNHGSCDFDTTIPAYNMTSRYQTVTCSCDKGYTGASCATVYDQCVNNPCGVGATCESLPPGTVNEFGLAYNCTKCVSGQELSEGKCIDAAVSELNAQNNESACVSIPCQNNGLCEGTNITYNCTCLAGTTGFNCETVLYTTEETTLSTKTNTPAISTVPSTQASSSTTTNSATNSQEISASYSTVFMILLQQIIFAYYG